MSKTVKNRLENPGLHGNLPRHLRRGKYSFYKVPQEPIDFNDISTRMSIGGMEITFNPSKLAGMVNLKPIVRFRDCEK